MRCLISNKSNNLMYIVLEPHTFLEDLLRFLVSCEKVISACERSLITPAMRKLIMDMPVPGRPSNLRPKGLKPCESMLYKLGKN